jgi:hypothetical protein
MPVLNYDKVEKDLPDLAKPQKCDDCGCIKTGIDMTFAYFLNGKIGVQCQQCGGYSVDAPQPAHNDVWGCPHCGVEWPAYQLTCPCGYPRPKGK